MSKSKAVIYLSVPEAAAKIGITQSWLRNRLRKEIIFGTKLGDKDWQIEPRAVRRFIRRNTRGGPPRVGVPTV